MAEQKTIETLVDRTEDGLLQFDEQLAVEDRMVLNMGPSHPSTHGVLRIVLTLAGEEIVAAEPDIGYLHRGMEKICEAYGFHKFIPYTDRWDYLAPIANNMTYVTAIEKLIGVEIPPRAQALRVISWELGRIQSHLLGLGAFAMDVGAMTVFLWSFRERELIYDFIERICGARFTTSFARIGGLDRDAPEDWLRDVKAFCKEFPKRVDEYETLLTRNRIWVDRLDEVGIFTREDALSYGLTGPNLRASGVEYDLRKEEPYMGYENYEFDVPVGVKGDCYDRYLCRIEEMRQSALIILQAIEKLPDGPFFHPDYKVSFPEKDKVLTRMEELIHHFITITEGPKAPKADFYFRAENPKGALGIYAVGAGTNKPQRLRIRGPSFMNLSILPKVLPGHMIADTVAILGSLDFVMGECDR
ncbi:MAG: NADH dehydrogenase (quinone) subunit D [Planctomycetota bacterium]|jgi:NADH-quinone oxidoreductase subunit D